MALRINSSSLLEKCFLELDSEGITYYRSAFVGGKHRFRYNQVDCVLFAPNNQLSLQVGTDVHSLQVDPNNKQHQHVVNALLQEVRRVNGVVNR